MIIKISTPQKYFERPSPHPPKNTQNITQKPLKIPKTVKNNNCKIKAS